ncbi:MAG: thermonuclease family protein [Anaerovoracaceae bacterium]
MNKKKLVTGIILAISILYLGIDGLMESDLYGPYEVVRVVDGDTIILDIEGTDERVRLIGINTQESVHPDSKRNVEFGKIASDYTKSMLEGKEVEIELDVEERDRYGRLLAYVYLNGEMFNKILLREGYAQISTYPPNVKYVDEFADLQEEARDNEKGFWKIK